MKNQYITPQIIVDSVCLQNVLLGSGGSKIGVGGETTGTQGDAPARRLSTMYI